VVGSADALEWSPNIDKDDVGRHPGLHGDQFQPTLWFQKAMTKIFTAFLWTGIEVAHGGKYLVAVQRPLHLSDFGRDGFQSARPHTPSLMAVAKQNRWHAPLGAAPGVGGCHLIVLSSIHKLCGWGWSVHVLLE
jgi:hypothetical protein